MKVVVTITGEDNAVLDAIVIESVTQTDIELANDVRNNLEHNYHVLNIDDNEG